MKRIIFIILAVGLLGVSFGAPLARFIPEVAALTIAFWRMSGGSLFLWASASVRSQGKLDKQKFLPIAVAGFFLALHFACFYSAVKLVPIANATLFATLAPVFTLIYERIMLKRTLAIGTLVGLWMAMGGVIIVQGTSMNFGEGETVGNLLALASSAFMAVVLIIAEQVRTSMTTIMYTRWLYLFASITLGCFAILAGVDLGFALSDVKWLGALILIPTLIGHNSMSYAVKYLRPTLVGSMPLGEPVLASILAWFLFGEVMSSQVIIGGGITLCGLIILSLKR